jgi:hypothetical protein
MARHASLACSQQAAIGISSVPDEPNPQLRIVVFKIMLILSLN